MIDQDYIFQDMAEAEKRPEFSVVPRGALLPDEVYAQYQVLRSRPPVPYNPPAQVVEISAKPELVTMPMKRAAIGLGFVSALGIAHSVVVANSAALVATVAPWIGGGFGLLCLGFLISCLRSGSGETKKGGNEYHYHYHNHYNQNNNTGNGSQSNGQ